LITAIGGLGGLAIWQHNKSSPTPGPSPAPIVNPVVKPDYPKGSRQWCDQKVADWSAEMANGTDDARSARPSVRGNAARSTVFA